MEFVRGSNGTIKIGILSRGLTDVVRGVSDESNEGIKESLGISENAASGCECKRDILRHERERSECEEGNAKRARSEREGVRAKRGRET